MKKYIRTKDGVWLNGGRFGKPYAGIVGKKQEMDFGFCFAKKDIINQADTIKDLCDCFIVDGLCDPFFATWEYVLHDDDRSNYDVYGAIFTDEGIKYVAKLNEEGELELL